MKLFLSIILIFSQLSVFAQYNSTSKEAGRIATISEKTNLLKNPDLNSNIITILNAGISIAVFEEVNVFSRIKTANYEGYVLSSKIKKEGTRSNSTSTKQSQRNSSSSTRTTKSSNNKSSSYSSTCGARTKKGGSCKRKVSGGGRCWQH